MAGRKAARLWCAARYALSFGFALVVAELALPASAAAQFSERSPLTGYGCPAPTAFDPGGGGRAAALYFGDDCLSEAKGVSSSLYAVQTSGSADTSFGGGDVSSFDYGEATECFDDLAGAAVDPATGQVYVSDAESGVSALFDFSDTATDLAQLGTPCDGSYSGGSLAEPQGLAIYDGNIYIAGGGKLLFTPLGLGSAVESQFPLAPADSNPIAIAIDSGSGDMFVLDNNGTVYEYNASGSYIGVFATGFGAAAFNDPTAVAVDPVAHVVYVADAGTGTVDTFSETTGAALLQTPVVSGEDPYGIALDTSNHVLYVADESVTDGDVNIDGGIVQSFSYTPAPSCSAGSASTKGGVASSLTLSCVDQAGASITYAVASSPAHGTLSGFNPATGAVTYTPDPGFDGSDTFTYTGSSVDGESDPTTVTVNVTGPTCSPETLQTPYQQPIAIQLACSDSASPVTAYTIIDEPTLGKLNAPSATGTLTYTPNGISVGIDSVTFEATDAAGQTSVPQTITIYVGTALPPPVQGQSANIYFAYGDVTILLPGQTTPIPLTGGFQAPLGSVVNAANGGAGVFVEDNGQEQGANFWNGDYKLTQQGDPQTDLYLLGGKIPKVRCAIHPHSFSGPFTLGQAQSLGGQRLSTLSLFGKRFHESGKPSRQLWGSGHGDFTTVGNGSSASVRGTEWAIFDYPDGTLTFDYTDSVSVYDFHRHKHILITAGHYYFAAIGGLPPCSKRSG